MLLVILAISLDISVSEALMAFHGAVNLVFAGDIGGMPVEGTQRVIRPLVGGCGVGILKYGGSGHAVPRGMD